MLAKLFKNNWVLLGFLFLATFLIRWQLVKNYNFPFWYDTGRDAIISREILEKGDLKIQGPVASGTGDKVFHGVLYYYLIGPAYTLAQGDPQLVVNFLTLVTSVATIFVYLLTKRLFNHSTALVTAGLYIFSYDSAVSATWFSNPVLVTVGWPAFFYVYWLVFYENKTKYFAWLMALLALCHQAAIFFIPWAGLVGVGLSWHLADKKLRKNWSWQKIALGGLIYFLGVASIFATQVRSMLISNSLTADSPFTTDMSVIIRVWDLFNKKWSRSLFAFQPIVSLGVVVTTGWLMSKKIEAKKLGFILLYATSPLWLFAFTFRNNYHPFLGLEVVSVILLAWLVTHLWHKKFWFISIVLVLMFLANQFGLYKEEIGKKASIYFVPQGAYLSDMLAAIDYSYQQADGQEFTISTLTNPYGYNSTWAYLYSWYGQKKYGYLPKFFGPDQVGLAGDDVLMEVAKPAPKHFAIIEPEPGIPQVFREWFGQDQRYAAGDQSIKTMFGTLEVVDYSQK